MHYTDQYFARDKVAEAEARFAEMQRVRAASWTDKDGSKLYAIQSTETAAYQNADAFMLYALSLDEETAIDFAHRRPSAFIRAVEKLNNVSD